MPKEYGVTKEGFVLKRLDTIPAEVNDYQKEGLGFDPSVNPQSFLSVLSHDAPLTMYLPHVIDEG